MPSFVQFKRTVRDMHADFGQPISSREAHSIAQSAWVSHLAEELTRAAEAYSLDYSDDTGETATDNALLDYLIRHGSLNPQRTAAHA